MIAERRYDEVPVYLEYLKYEVGGEEKALEKIEKLKSYLSEGLPRYQDVLEQENRKLPAAPEGIEYRDPRSNGKPNIHSTNKKIQKSAD